MMHVHMSSRVCFVNSVPWTLRKTVPPYFSDASWSLIDSCLFIRVQGLLLAPPAPLEEDSGL